MVYHWSLQNIMECHRYFTGTHGISWYIMGVPGAYCARVHALIAPLGSYLHVLVHTGIYWYILVYSIMY
jgi:hypothetical protein